MNYADGILGPTFHGSKRNVGQLSGEEGKGVGDCVGETHKPACIFA